MQDVRKDRDLWVGGSDIPVILGISPFKKRFSLVQEKAGVKEDDFDGNEYTEYGNILEPQIRDYINKKFGMNYIEYKIENPEKRIRCHLDGYDADFNDVLEIKTTSQIKETVEEYKVYLSQELTYISEIKGKHGLLAVYERPDNFDTTFDASRLHLYDVYLDNYGVWVEEIYSEVARFWEDVEYLKQNPDLEESDFINPIILKSAYALDKLENDLKTYKELTKQYDNLKIELFNLMEQYGVKSFELPNGTKIQFTQNSKDSVKDDFDLNTFKEENPELYQKYLYKKVVKGKKGYVSIKINE